MTIVALFNIKGGVGKTTAAVNLAHVASRDGARTLLWDLDPQGAASYYLGGGEENDREPPAGVPSTASPLGIRSTGHERLDLLSARGSRTSIRELLEPVGVQYDYVFIDCPAGLTPIAGDLFATADALVVPTIPTTLSMRTLEQLRTHLSRHEGYRPMVLPFLSMLDRRRKLHQEISRQVLRDDRFLSAWVPYSSPVERMGVHRSPLSCFARTSAPNHAFELLWGEIESRLSGEHASTFLSQDDGVGGSAAHEGGNGGPGPGTYRVIEGGALER